MFAIVIKRVIVIIIKMSKRISLDDIVRTVAGSHGLTLVETRAIIDSVFATIKSEVADQNDVSVTKFGTFSSAYSAPYMARNPRTGGPVSVPAKQRVRFRAFDDFRSVIN